MHHEIAIRSPQQGIEPDDLFIVGEVFPHHFIGAGREGRGKRRIVVRAQRRAGDDRGVGVLLESPARRQCGALVSPGVEHNDARPAAQRERNELVGIADDQYRLRLPRQPVGQQGGRRDVMRCEQDGADLVQTGIRPKWSGKIRLTTNEVKPCRRCELRHARASRESEIEERHRQHSIHE